MVRSGLTKWRILSGIFPSITQNKSAGIEKFEIFPRLQQKHNSFPSYIATWIIYSFKLTQYMETGSLECNQATVAHFHMKIAHFTDFLNMIMSTRKYLLYASMCKIKATVASLAKGSQAKINLYRKH
jgi:hypothetical protein